MSAKRSEKQKAILAAARSSRLQEGGPGSSNPEVAAVKHELNLAKQRLNITNQALEQAQAQLVAEQDHSADLYKDLRVVRRKQQRTATSKMKAITESMNKLEISEKVQEENLLLADKIKTLDDQNKNMVDKNQHLLDQNKDLSDSNQRLLGHNQYLEGWNNHLQDKNEQIVSLNEQLLSQTQSLLVENTQLKEENSDLEKQLQKLLNQYNLSKDRLEEFRRKIKNVRMKCARAPEILEREVEEAKHEAQTITLMDGGIYSEEVRDLCCILAGAGCAHYKIGPLIVEIFSSVGLNVKGKTVSGSTVARAILEGGIMADMQIGHELSNTENLTVSGDGTTHKHVNYES